MKFAFASDIHSNLEALESSLSVIEEEGSDALICLGDMIGYGPDPNECVELIREKFDLCLAGNHDQAAIGLLDTSYFNEFAKHAVDWTASVLHPHNAEYLRSLEIVEEKWDLLFAHSTPFQPEMWNYIFTIDDARLNFAFFRQFICFIGHSHQPFIVGQNPEGTIAIHSEFDVDLDPAWRYIVNVGSVGQPRDGNPDSCIGFYDTETHRMQLRRVSYDIARVQKKMQELGLPDFLAERLAIGR